MLTAAIVLSHLCVMLAGIYAARQNYPGGEAVQALSTLNLGEGAELARPLKVLLSSHTRMTGASNLVLPSHDASGTPLEYSKDESKPLLDLLELADIDVAVVGDEELGAVKLQHWRTELQIGAFAGLRAQWRSGPGVRVLTRALQQQG